MQRLHPKYLLILFSLVTTRVAFASQDRQPPSCPAFLNIQQSSAVDGIGLSAILRYQTEAAHLEKIGEKVIKWGIGQSPLPPPIALDRRASVVAQERLGQRSASNYGENKGLLKLRQSISGFYSKYFQLDFDPQRFIVFPGSKLGIFHALAATEGSPLLPYASWNSYEPQAKSLGKAVVRVPTTLGTDFKITARDFESFLQTQYVAGTLTQAAQKVLILASPNNPTGASYTREEIVSLVPLFRKHHIVLIEDAIYAGPWDAKGRNRFLFAQEYPEGTLFSAGISKNFAGADFRVGFLAFPQGEAGQIVFERTAAMFGNSASPVATAQQEVAAEAYSGRKSIEDYLKKTEAIHSSVLSFLRKRMQAVGLEMVNPDGGIYLFVDFSRYRKELKNLGVSTSVELSSYLFDHLRIVTVPGSEFNLLPESLTLRVAAVNYDGAKVYRLAPRDGVLSDQFILKNMNLLTEGADRLENFILKLVKN